MLDVTESHFYVFIFTYFFLVPLPQLILDKCVSFLIIFYLGVLFSIDVYNFQCDGVGADHCCLLGDQCILKYSSCIYMAV